MMLGDTNNRFSASRAVVVLASGLLVGLFLVALLSQMLARIDALDALTQMRLATTLQNLIMFMLPAVAVGTLCGGGTPLRFLRLDKAPSAMAVAGIVLISLAMTPAMNWLVAWNASLSLPEAMKPVEQWMRAQENAAQEATDTLLSGSSVWDLIASVVCVGLLTGLGEEMFFRGATACGADTGRCGLPLSCSARSTSSFSALCHVLCWVPSSATPICGAVRCGCLS